MNPVKRFMEHQHEEIFRKIDQGSTYTNISVDIFESISNMGRTDITDFVDKGKLLRVAECSVEKVKQARFEQMPKDAGNRGMIPGMLSGTFGKRQNGRYLAA